MSVTSASQLILAPAKLTLSLRVTGVRNDGYHLIDAIMTTLDLHDELHISHDHSGLEFRGPYSAGITTDSDNLVSRALVSLIASRMLPLSRTFRTAADLAEAQLMLQQFSDGHSAHQQRTLLRVPLSEPMFRFVLSAVKRGYQASAKSSNR